MGDKNSKPSVLRIAAIYLIVSLVILGLSLLFFYPWHPVTWLGWLALYLIVPPAWGLLEWLGSKLGQSKLSTRINPDTTKFSIGRVGVGVLIYAPLILGLMFGIHYLTDGNVGFIDSNFSNQW